MTTRNGIAAGASKKAFYLGSAVAGTLLGSLLLWRYFSRRRRTSSSLIGASELERVKPLAAVERIEPIPADKLAGQRCSGCDAPAQGKGAWYKLKGRTYCQECAQGQAGKAGVELVRPAVVRLEPNLKYPKTGRRTTLKPRLVKVGPVDNVVGYAVWSGNKDTGLTLVPEVKIDVDGTAKINQARWFVNYDRAAKPVAGPYESISESKGMASLLAHFDWTKEVASFSDEEIRQTLKMTHEYRQELSFKRYMAQITQ